MISVERTFDGELVTRTMRHPRLYEHISDDGCPPADEFSAPVSENIIYLAVHEESAFLGIFMFHPQNFACYEVHTCLLPAAWGAKAVESTAAAAKWMFENTPCRRIVTNIPAYNTLAMRLARRSGMEQYGVNPKSFLKNNVLHDQAMLGLNKEQSCQQQQ